MDTSEKLGNFGLPPSPISYKVNMGFTKLDEGILQSSIMAEDSDTFKIWISLLAACKENGVAYISPVFLSSICRMDLDVVMKSLQKLQDPDPLSRSLDQDGRRIRRIDGGFEIINYQVYRTRSLRSAEAERKRLYRSTLKEEKEEEEEEAEAEASGQVRTPGESVRTLSDGKHKHQILFKFEDGTWEGIKGSDIGEWEIAFPAVDIVTEIKRAGLWLEANPEKKKKNYRRFIFNWLSRSQERGGSFAARRPERIDKVGLNKNKVPMTVQSWESLRRSVERNMREGREVLLKAGRITKAELEDEVKTGLALWEKSNPKPKEG